jgi:RNA polymerase sigma-70 factor (ECF subfamily)
MSDPIADTSRSVRMRSPRQVHQKPAVDSTAHVLDPSLLPDHIDALYRAAWALSGSREDAEDLVQTTFTHLLKRRRIIRSGNERAYLLRALRNTYSSRYRTLASRPATVPLVDEDTYPTREDAPVSPHQLMEAIAAAPSLYRDAVIAVDLLGLSYREAARSLHTGEQTIATRVHRGRQHIARELIERGV